MRRISLSALTTTLALATALLVVAAPSDAALIKKHWSKPLSDRAAAKRVHHTSWEPRPDNRDENRRVPTKAELATFHSHNSEWDGCAKLRNRVTGHYKGRSTDDVIQWAAAKWSISPRWMRAAATTESWWHMSTIGDNGESFGLYQVRAKYHPGTYPISVQSTAFNADYYGAILRYYYEGCAMWMNTVERGQEYRAGDFYGSAGAWFSGRWHLNIDTYIAKTKGCYDRKTWRHPDFLGG
jgi:hypothetical protein